MQGAGRKMNAKTVDLPSYNVNAKLYVNAENYCMDDAKFNA